MIRKNIFLQFLYLLSSKAIKKDLYLEGGAALSFIYGQNRVFSNDLDFTIENKKLLKKFLNSIEEIIKEINPAKYSIRNVSNNKIIIKSGRLMILQIDVYVVSAKLFLWEEKELNLNNKKFTLRVHSFIDLFAEKITNIFQKDRCEFKDIIDINNIYKTIKTSVDPENFSIYLRNKFVGKKMHIQIKNNPILSYLNRKIAFKKSFLTSPKFKGKSFDKEFESCRRIMEIYL